MPVDRNWNILEDPERMPEISFDPETGDLLIQPRVVRDDDPDSLLEAVFEAIGILRRVGGTIQIASQRGELAPQVVVTESFIFAYNSFTPLVRRLGDNQGEEAQEALDDATFPSMETGQMGEVIEEAKDEEEPDPTELEAAAAVE